MIMWEEWLLSFCMVLRTVDEYKMKRSLFWLIVIGGALVLMSDLWVFGQPTAVADTLWGPVPQWLLPIHQINMMLAALGFFPFSKYFLRIDAERTRLFAV